ncbi:alpha/beta hydrolase [Microbacterium timonense]|uniref:alpha/beta hydrolase n=1 Tax=Microbacterium timonense TaxID=2086576 RepID=UPI000D0F3153|nr:alpha/beta hydrolase [Microbacterium timonense]
MATRSDIVTTLTEEQIPALRAQAIVPADADLTFDGRFELSRHVTTGPDDNGVPLIVLRPREVSSPPVIYHVHGGGMVVGTATDVLPALAPLAARVGAAIVAVEYRLAPENRYPAAVEDVYAGLEWVAQSAADLGMDPARIIIDGVSAGGGLAAATALLARDRRGPRLIGQMLVCPMLDDRNDSASGYQMAGSGAWDRTANATGWAAYLGDLPREDVPIYASPGRATDLSGLPPTFIDVGSAETFRDEDVAYATRIWAAGGDAELHVWPGGVHGFDALAPDAPLSEDARNARARWLERLLRA